MAFITIDNRINSNNNNYIYKIIICYLSIIADALMFKKQYNGSMDHDEANLNYSIGQFNLKNDHSIK